MFPLSGFFWGFDFDFSNKQNQSNLVNVALLLGTATGLVYTANNIHQQYHQNLLLKASNYVEKWYSPELKESVQTVKDLTHKYIKSWGDNYIEDKENLPPEYFANSIILSRKYGSLDSLKELSEAQIKVAEEILDNRSDIYGKVKNILALFEHMGQDVIFGTVDTHYLKDFFYLIVIHYYELFRVYIESLQEKYGQFVYCNFVSMAQTWERECLPPKIPKVSIKSILDNQRILLADKPELLEIQRKILERC